VESIPHRRRIAVDEARLAELRREWFREPRSKEEEEGRLLAFMEYMIAVGPEDLHAIARVWARRLRKRPQDWEKWVLRSTACQKETWCQKATGCPNAKGCQLAWWAVRYLVTHMRENAPGQLVRSAPLMYWAIDVATGRSPEPKPDGRSSLPNLWRDCVIFVTVEGIVEVGLRTATAKVKEKSACYLVAKRLLGVEYDRVQDIWTREKKRTDASPKPDLRRVETRLASSEAPTV